MTPPGPCGAAGGPASGILHVPLSVHWGPRRTFDLDDPRDSHAAYRAIIREGTTAVQEELLNAEVLQRLWPDLMLPHRCRLTWEEHFPDFVVVALCR